MKKTADTTVYDVIIIGAGASGLFYAATDSPCKGSRGLILEKTGRPGQKLLMSGNGACNITHGGSIKDFIDKYGSAGSKIRTCLYKHNNLELMNYLEKGGVKLMEREDEKVFPASMKASDILNLLLRDSGKNGYEIRTYSEVTGITYDTDGCPEVSLADGSVLSAKKLVIATGGASYPATGSDGSFMEIIRRDLGVSVRDLKPALAPVYVQDYQFSDISGVSLEDVCVSASGKIIRGPLLFTHRSFSGLALLHISQYIRTGDTLRISYLPDRTADDILMQMKAEQPANSRGVANYLSQAFGLPKAFAVKLYADPTKKFSSIKNSELEDITRLITDSHYSVSGTGGWNEAMVTAGGIDLSEIDIKKMSLIAHPAIRVIGEALDVNGDTGGYNLQFAYSSARMAQA